MGIWRLQLLGETYHLTTLHPCSPQWNVKQMCGLLSVRCLLSRGGHRRPSIGSSLLSWPSHGLPHPWDVPCSISLALGPNRPFSTPTGPCQASGLIPIPPSKTTFSLLTLLNAGMTFFFAWHNSKSGHRFVLPTKGQPHSSCCCMAWGQPTPFCCFNKLCVVL